MRKQRVPPGIDGAEEALFRSSHRDERGAELNADEREKHADEQTEP